MPWGIAVSEAGVNLPWGTWLTGGSTQRRGRQSQPGLKLHFPRNPQGGTNRRGKLKRSFGGVRDPVFGGGGWERRSAYIQKRPQGRREAKVSLAVGPPPKKNTGLQETKGHPPFKTGGKQRPEKLKGKGSNPAKKGPSETQKRPGGPAGNKASSKTGGLVWGGHPNGEVMKGG